MPSRKTLVLESIDSVSSKPVSKTSTKTKKNKLRNITEEHLNQALTMYLRSLSMIEDNEEVVTYFSDHNYDHFVNVETMND